MLWSCSEKADSKKVDSVDASDQVQETSAQAESVESTDSTTAEPSGQQSKPKVLISNAPEVQEAKKAQPQQANEEPNTHTAMPSHQSPEQAKIDSIKAAKQKGKK